MRRTLRTLLIGVLVVALTFNPAAAWFFGRGGCGWHGGYGGCGYGGWGGYRSHGHSYYGSYYGGSGYYGYGHSPVVYHDSCCDDGYGGGWDSCCESGCYDGTVVESGEPMMERAPAAPAEAPSPGGRQMPPPQMREPSNVQRPMDTTPVPQLPTEPMPPTTEPADTLTPPAEEPAAPADDLFNGTEATTTPPQDETPADDLFGPMTEETTPPAETETTPPADTTPPAETESTDDLFGAPPAEGTTPTEGETPAEEPATTESTDDLFGTSETATEDTAPMTEGTEEAPADTETETPAETPAEEDTDEGKAEEDTDIFGTGTSNVILREPGGLASAEFRTWVDNTGSYSCRGRLVRFLDGQVRLLKDNGRTTTVPLYRLSAGDLAFVHRQASAQQASVAGQLAQTMSGLPLLAN